MIRVEGLCVQAGAFALGGVGFEVPTGAHGVLMGRSGVGKTTILESICGLRELQRGRITLAGRDVTELKPAERGVGYVPQDGVLFRGMTVRGHLELPLEVRRWRRAERRRRVEEVAHLVGVEKLLSRTSQGLSGGEVQRVALGRALSFSPGVLLLDEPVSALDEQARIEMCQLLKRVQQQTAVTTLHVTHNREAAAVVADVLFELSGGEVRAAAVPTLERRG